MFKRMFTCSAASPKGLRHFSTGFSLELSNGLSMALSNGLSTLRAPVCNLLPRWSNATSLGESDAGGAVNADLGAIRGLEQNHTIQSRWALLDPIQRLR